MSTNNSGELPQPTEPIDAVHRGPMPSEEDAQWLTWRERSWVAGVLLASTCIWVVAIVKACGD